MKMGKRVRRFKKQVLGKKLAKQTDLRYLALGAAAVFGLRQLSKRGIFPKEMGAALDGAGPDVEQPRKISAQKSAAELRADH